MALPRDLLNRVVNGTLQESALINATDTALDYLLVQKGSHEEYQMLLMAGGIYYRQQAGFVPGQKHEITPLPGSPKEKRPPCSRRSLHYLNAMLGGYLMSVMPEFLTELNNREERIPGESLPSMLTLGEHKIPWQSLIRPVLGERGHWLAEVSGKDEWQWVWHVPTHLNVPENPPFSEDSLIKLLRKSGKILHPYHRAIESLKDYKQPWSDKLTDELLEKLRRHVKSKPQHSQAYVTMAMSEFAVYIPVERKTEILRILNIRTNATYREKWRNIWHEAAKEVQKVFEFREGMLRAIHKRR